MNAMSDPFPIVKEDIQNNVQKYHELFHHCEQLFGYSDREFTIPELEKNIIKMKKLMNNIELEYQDLEAALNKTIENPQKYPFEKTEINRRKEFLIMIKSSIKTNNEEIRKLEKKKLEFKEKNENLTRNLLLNSSGGKEYILNQENEVNIWDSNTPSSDHSNSNYNNENGSNFYDTKLIEQKAYLQMQDQHLENIAITVGSIKGQAREIHTELNDQARLLGEMHNDFDTLDGKFSKNMSKLNRFYESSKRGSNKFIFILIIVLIVLLIVLIVI